MKGREVDTEISFLVGLAHVCARVNMYIWMDLLESKTVIPLQRWS